MAFEYFKGFVSGLKPEQKPKPYGPVLPADIRGKRAAESIKKNIVAGAEIFAKKTFEAAKNEKNRTQCVFQNKAPEFKAPDWSKGFI